MDMGFLEEGLYVYIQVSPSRMCFLNLELIYDTTTLAFVCACACSAWAVGVAISVVVRCAATN